MTSVAEKPHAGFDTMGLAPEIFSAVSKAGFVTPTPIQAQAIVPALEGEDLIGIAQTGTGKTMAFSLPILSRLSVQPGTALILVPTRELALQVEESIRKVTTRLHQLMRTISLIGGAPMYRQIQDLKRRPRIIVATPGRLRDHMERRTVDLSGVAVVVLDEADRMLDMGFEPQIRQICSTLPENRQTLLFSATMEPKVAGLAQSYLHNPVRIEIERQGVTADLVTQEVCYVSQDQKLTLLTSLLDRNPGTVLVFSRTKHGARKITHKLRDMRYTAAEIHSDRSLGQRKEALQGFKSGKYRVLVATDVASRGIDVNDISLVVNYDLPDAAEDYVHRVGRTGRAGKKGHAISFACPDQRRDVQNIERLTRQTLQLSQDSLAVPAAPAGHSREQSIRGHRRFHRHKPHHSQGWRRRGR